MSKEQKTIYLHIGEPKCASSSLQEFFRLHRADLLASGIMYPGVEDGPLKITSGNLSGLTSMSGIQARIVNAVKAYPDYNLLFSSEWLFPLLSSKSQLAETQELFKSLGYELHVIWITREIIDHLTSEYFHQQKESPQSPKLSNFETKGMKWFPTRLSLISELKKMSISHVVFNLNHSNPIQQYVFSHLGVKVNSFAKIPRMNRALSKPEFVLSNALNFLDPNGVRTLMNKLNENNPDTEPMKISFNAEEKQILGNSLNPMIKRFNSHLPKQSQLGLITVESENEGRDRAMSLMELNQLYFDDSSKKIIESWCNDRIIRRAEAREYFKTALKNKILRKLGM